MNKELFFKECNKLILLYYENNKLKLEKEELSNQIKNGIFFLNLLDNLKILQLKKELKKLKPKLQQFEIDIKAAKKEIHFLDLVAKSNSSDSDGENLINAINQELSNLGLYTENEIYTLIFN